VRTRLFGLIVSVLIIPAAVHPADNVGKNGLQIQDLYSRHESESGEAVSSERQH
jgi:hypothetical protein